MKNRNIAENTTQLHLARKGVISAEARFVAEQENLDPEFIRSEVVSGRLIIPANIRHTCLKPMAIGIATRCKVNVNIGNSPLGSGLECELEKLQLSLKYGADTLMDLSTGSDINRIRGTLIKNSPIPIGTVPIYQALQEVEAVEDLTIEGILRVIEYQAEQGVDYMTVHCGLIRELVPLAKKRVTGIVSRGGAILAQWMEHYKKENPLYENYDRILDICRKYDVALSLGDGLRPGSLADASDEAQFGELKVLGDLTKKAWEKDVQVMIEGPGHIPLDQIAMNVEKEIELCHGAPFYVLGPIVTDIAAGYDHISSSIGAAIAAQAGAAMLCYVTPKEHLGLPNAEDVRAGLIAYKIAAHAADVGRHRPGARNRDDEMSKARYRFDWERQFELALDPDRAREYHDETLAGSEFKNADYCSMCGPKFCAMNISRKTTHSEKA